MEDTGHMDVTKEVTRATVDADSTAVLAFDDGVRIPCVRFIVRLFCGVLKSVMETTTCGVDERHRTVIPIPRMDSAPFWDAIDMLHGLKTVSHVTTPEECVAVIECMMYMGAALQVRPLEGRLWALIQGSEDLGLVVGHAPRLLRNDVLAPRVVAKLVRLRPMWRDFCSDVLRALRVHADLQVVTAVATHTGNFFPPNLVVYWAMDALEGRAPFGFLRKDDALKLASVHGVNYHPCETVGLLRRLAALSDDMLWDPALSPMLRSVASSLEKYDVLPENRSHVHGTQIKFSDSANASVCVALGHKPPAHLRLTPWLRLSFSGETGYDLAFKPKKIDELSMSCRAVQLRVMCFDKLDPPQGSCAECWHFFDVDPTHADSVTYTLAHAHKVMGDPASQNAMLRRRAVRLMRLDFFFGSRDILDNPVDTRVQGS